MMRMCWMHGMGVRLRRGRPRQCPRPRPRIGKRRNRVWVWRGRRGGREVRLARRGRPGWGRVHRTRGLGGAGPFRCRRPRRRDNRGPSVRLGELVAVTAIESPANLTHLTPHSAPYARDTALAASVQPGIYSASGPTPGSGPSHALQQQQQPPLHHAGPPPSSYVPPHQRRRPSYYGALQEHPAHPPHLSPQSSTFGPTPTHPHPHDAPTPQQPQPQNPNLSTPDSGPSQAGGAAARQPSRPW
ncbi:hypothetical protein K439DRAFT_1198806 [Ramaria rubella]|nr:hypothetical protein K439DRAFT_1198806 [Ramaria rubella]